TLPSPTSRAASSPHSFRPADGIPEGRLGPRRPLRDCGQRRLEFGLPEQPTPHDRLARSRELYDHVVDESRPGWHARRRAEEDPGVPHRLRAGFVQKRAEPPADEGIATQPIVAALKGPPERGEARRLRPGAKDVVVVVLQHEPAA